MHEIVFATLNLICTIFLTLNNTTLRKRVYRYVSIFSEYNQLSFFPNTVNRLALETEFRCIFWEIRTGIQNII
jgi:hypothetical protein